jgi:hypothetical protein
MKIYEPISVSNPVGRFLDTFNRHLVCLNIKVYEEAQIAGKECTAKDGRTFRSGTVADNGKAKMV